jgi:hypothetical protein
MLFKAKLALAIRFLFFVKPALHHARIVFFVYAPFKVFISLIDFFVIASPSAEGRGKLILRRAQDERLFKPMIEILTSSFCGRIPQNEGKRERVQ